MKRLKTALAAIAIGVAALTSQTGEAQARGLSVQLEFTGGKGSVHGYAYRGYHGRPWYRYGKPGYKHGYRPRGHRYHGCGPERAVHKARRYGLRHTGIYRITSGYIIVTGRRHGHQAWITFYRSSRSCRIASAYGI